MGSEFVVVFLVPIVLIFIVGFGVYFVERAGCNAKWKEIPNSYSVLSGCMIYVDDQWIPEANYRIL